MYKILSKAFCSRSPTYSVMPWTSPFIPLKMLGRCYDLWALSTCHKKKIQQIVQQSCAVHYQPIRPAEPLRKNLSFTKKGPPLQQPLSWKHPWKSCFDPLVEGNEDLPPNSKLHLCPLPPLWGSSLPFSTLVGAHHLRQMDSESDSYRLFHPVQHCNSFPVSLHLTMTS